MARNKIIKEQKTNFQAKKYHRLLLVSGSILLDIIH